MPLAGARVAREFSLSPAEDGHPIWGPVYRNVRTQLIMEREAAQDRGKPIIPLSKSEQMLADAKLAGVQLGAQSRV